MVLRDVFREFSVLTSSLTLELALNHAHFCTGTSMDITTPLTTHEHLSQRVTSDLTHLKSEILLLERVRDCLTLYFLND